MKLIDALKIIFKYWNNTKACKQIRNDANQVIGVVFREISLDNLISDENFGKIESSGLNLRYGKAGSTWLDKDGNVQQVKADYVYVGEDTRKEHANADSLLV